VKSEKEKDKISEEVKQIKLIDSKFLIKINDFFIENENQKEICCIITDYFEYGNLENIINQKYSLNYRIIWRMFIQIALGIKAFHKNNIILKNLCPRNIFIDNERNIKIGGYGLILDFIDEEYLNSLSLYTSPELLNGQDYTKKSDIWSLGCIIYELFFKKRPFQFLDNILKVNYEMADNYDNDLKYFLPKLLCQENKRILINELLNDMKLKKKLIEVNLFDEIVEENLKGKYS
jgi:serine/threonine protein kinase